MPIDTLDNCPHERRPGTTVCLHCRHEQLLQVRARRRDLAARLAVVAVAIGVLGVIGSAGLAAWRAGQSADATILLAAVDGSGPSNEAAAATTTEADEPAASAATEGSPSAPAASRTGALAAPAPAAAPTRVPERIAPPLHPVVAEGHTALPDSLYARRVGEVVHVHFDTPLTRTRRPEKFERIVRATLPLVYGPRMDSLLAAVPEGSIARAGELLTELPAKGFRLPAPDGWWLELRPSTRPGEDGPLVVTYRVSVVR
jgi:hypothetical protein